MERNELNSKSGEIEKVGTIIKSTRFALMLLLATILSAIYPNNSVMIFDLLAIAGSFIFLVFNWLRNSRQTENLSK